MNQALLNGLVMVDVPEFAMRDDMLASLVDPLPLMSPVASAGLSAETRDTAVVAASRAVGRFDLAVQEASFQEVEGPRRVGAVGGDRVVGVV